MGHECLDIVVPAICLKPVVPLEVLQTPLFMLLEGLKQIGIILGRFQKPQ